jgi:class 3 adenylate cyclase/CHASE2 domain-containing sensor protein
MRKVSAGLWARLAAALEPAQSATGPRAAMARSLVTAGVALVVTLIALAAATTTPVRFAEHFAGDLRIALTAPPNREPLVIVKMDGPAYEAMQAASPCHCTAPVDKAWLADLIAGLSAKGARAIVVDYLLDTWRSDQEYRGFVAKVSHLPTPVIVGVDADRRPGVDYPIVPGVRYSDPRTLISREYDTVVREYNPKPSQFRAMAAEAAAALGARPPTQPFLLRYRKPDPTLTAENTGAIAPSFSAAFAAALPPDLIKGKVAFIGVVDRSEAAASTTLGEDMHLTPLRFLTGNEAGTPGVELHAHALSQMLAGDRVRPLGLPATILIVFLAALGGAALGGTTQKWWISALVLAAFVMAGGAAAFAALPLFGVLAPISSPVIAFALAFFVTSRLAAVRLASERTFYSSTLERYLSPSVIDRIVDGSEPLRIGADEREISVLVSDLENFSGLVANTSLEEFSRIINAYFDGLIEILWKYEALIDKMTGDGVIAIFGAPVAQPDHADRALACIRELCDYGEKFRQETRIDGFTIGRTRVGLSSGIGLVGNFGGERRFNYTCYGEVIVVAARLEAANKEFDTTLLFSGATLERAHNAGAVRSVGEIRLKGVPEPVAAYTFA